jgi:hypothetical protein
VRRVNRGHTWRNALTGFACIAATVVGACAGGDGGYTDVEYGYGGGVYYASAWNDPWYHGGPIYVGPPAGPPPGAIGGGPPRVSTMPAPMPAPRPAAGVGGGGGGRRR